MLIDDDEPTNFLNNMFMEEANCSEHIKIVSNGFEAIKYLNSAKPMADSNMPFPDLIFLDINMPAMDGWEFLDRYKEIKTVARPVIVMLTTSLNPDDILKAYTIPEVSGFENKPLTTEKINVIVKKYFSVIEQK
jgi:CheY-like chemotaxis protein